MSKATTRLPEPTRVALPAARCPRGGELEPITLSVHEAGPAHGLAVVLCHGFPELAFSWRHQIQALAEAGFRVIAPDMRGYGASDCPEEIEAYDLSHLMGDLVRLLDVRGVDKAVFAGHDWGGFVAWGMPIAYPDRTAGVVGVNTPYVAFPQTKTMRLAVPEDERLYVLWFQRPGIAEALLDRDPRLLFEKMMRCASAPEGATTLAERAADGDTELDANPFRRLDELPEIGKRLLSKAELDVYSEAFAKSGFRGGINWYRNIDANAERWPEIGTQKLDLPCLMVTAEWDLALPPSAAAGMTTLCSNLETRLIEGCGHWTQQEKPDELDSILIDWLRRSFR